MPSWSFLVLENCSDRRKAKHQHCKIRFQRNLHYSLLDWSMLNSWFMTVGSMVLLLGHLWLLDFEPARCHFNCLGSVSYHALIKGRPSYPSASVAINKSSADAETSHTWDETHKPKSINPTLCQLSHPVQAGHLLHMGWSLWGVSFTSNPTKCTIIYTSLNLRGVVLSSLVCS